LTWPPTLHNTQIQMIDLDARFCLPGPTSSALHKTTHKKERNTHWQRPRWTHSQECLKEELMVSGVDGTGDPVTCITTVSNDFVRRLLGAHTAGLWRAVFVWRFKAAFGPGRAGPRSQKRNINLWSQRWCEMVPDKHPPKSHSPMCSEKWSQRANIDTNPLIYWLVDLWWSILTSTVNPPTGEYGWYWHWPSRSIHLQRITVNRWSSIKISR